MGNLMIFSVVIPVYNVEKYLVECLDSILSQSFKDFEVLLIDDGSNDSSGEICDKYQDRFDNVRVIHKKNEGLISARREGYRHASGEYIINCDSDDYIEPDTLSSLYDVIKSSQPDMIIYNSYISCDGERSIFNEHLFSEGYVKKEQIFDMLLLNSQVNSLCMKTYKKELIDIEEDYSDFYNYNYGEDLLQSIPLVIKCNSIYYLDKQLYNYRIGSGMTYKYNNTRYWSFKEVYYKLKEALKIISVDEPDYKLSKFLVHVAYDAIHVNLEVGEYHENDVMKIVNDEEFREAYNLIRKSKYMRMFTKKQRIILEMIYFKFFIPLKVLFIIFGNNK